MIDFDNLIEYLSDLIYEFWDNLLHNREIREIYDKGMLISDKIKDL